MLLGSDWTCEDKTVIDKESGLIRTITNLLVLRLFLNCRNFKTVELCFAKKYIKKTVVNFFLLF